MKNNNKRLTTIPTLPNASTTLSAVQQAWDGNQFDGLNALPMAKVDMKWNDSIGVAQIKKCIDRLQIKVENAITHPVRPEKLDITVILSDPARPLLEEALKNAGWHIKAKQERPYSITFSTEK